MNDMTKWAINVMGYWEDKDGNYEADTVEHLFEQFANNYEPMKVVSVSVKQLPDDYTVIDKNDVKKRDRISLKKNKK